MLSSTVSPCSSTSCRMISHSSRRDSGSTPTVGSSSSSSSGERTSVQASPSFLLHAARQLAGQPTRERAQGRHLHETRISFAPLLGRDAVQSRRRGRGFPGRSGPRTSRTSAACSRCASCTFCGSAATSMPSTVNSPASGCHQTGDQADERRLAGAVRSDQGGERARLGFEGDAVERLDDFARLAAEGLADFPTLQNGRLVFDGNHRRLFATFGALHKGDRPLTHRCSQFCSHKL